MHEGLPTAPQHHLTHMATCKVGAIPAVQMQQALLLGRRGGRALTEHLYLELPESKGQVPAQRPIGHQPAAQHAIKRQRSHAVAGLRKAG